MNFIEALKEVADGKTVTAPSLMNLRQNEAGWLEVVDSAHSIRYMGDGVKTMMDVLRDKTKCWEIVD